VKNWLVIFQLLVPALLQGQGRDSLFVVQDRGSWSIRHRVRPAETIFLLSRRYAVPPAILAEANGKTYSDGLATGSIINVPTGPYNWLGPVKTPNSDTKPVYYHTAPGDDLYKIARQAGMTKRDLMAQNGLLTDAPPAGKVLFVGWLKFDESTLLPVSISTNQPQDKRPVTPVAVSPKKDTPKYILPPSTDKLPADPPVPKFNPTLSDLWNEQTLNGMNATTEKVTAGFFSTGKGAAMYAFHNSAARGTILKVQNMNNGRAIYVKVLGILPSTKAFLGCSLGLSSAAKAALDVRDQKAFCEISYASY
jgi:LysM repeat protein